jgi:hypothetical protein
MLWVILWQGKLVVLAVVIFLDRSIHEWGDAREIAFVMWRIRSLEQISPVFNGANITTHSVD